MQLLTNLAAARENARSMAINLGRVGGPKDDYSGRLVTALMSVTEIQSTILEALLKPATPLALATVEAAKPPEPPKTEPGTATGPVPTPDKPAPTAPETTVANETPPIGPKPGVGVKKPRLRLTAGVGK